MIKLKKKSILQIISNKTNGNKKKMGQIWKKNKLKECLKI
jgi:hypothetical protein